MSYSEFLMRCAIEAYVDGEIGVLEVVTILEGTMRALDSGLWALIAE